MTKNLLTAVLLMAAMSAQAQTIAFLEITDIPGESLFSGYEDQIELINWSQTVANVGGPPVVMPLRFQHTVDRSTPLLVQAALLNTDLGDATLSVVRTNAGPSPVSFLTLVLDSARVAAVEAASNSNNIPIETVTLTCTTFSISYRKQNDDGTFDDPITTTGPCQ